MTSSLALAPDPKMGPAGTPNAQENGVKDGAPSDGEGVREPQALDSLMPETSKFLYVLQVSTLGLMTSLETQLFRETDRRSQRCSQKFFCQEPSPRPGVPRAEGQMRAALIGSALN